MHRPSRASLTHFSFFSPVNHHAPSHHLFTPLAMAGPRVDIDHLLQAIHDGLLLHSAHAGAVRIVIESEAGEPLHVFEIDARRPLTSETLLPLSRSRPMPLAQLIAATAAVEADGVEQCDLLQRCHEQQQRIADLEQQLRQVQQELQHHATPSSLTAPPSPASSTDDDTVSSANSVNGSPHGSDTHDDDHDREPSTGLIAMTDEVEHSPSSTSPLCPEAPGMATSSRQSERPKTNVDRWTPSRAASSYEKRQTKRRSLTRCAEDDKERSTCSDTDSVDDDDDGDAVDVAALVAKLREGHDKRRSVTLDSLSKESVVSLHQRVLNEADNLVSSTTSGQITSLITTSSSLRMVGYYLRAILAHRLKVSSRKCYKRLARETLGIKSPNDVAAYPALYELVELHYPGLASATIEAWLENPIFTADVTWTEWKRCLTKPGRPIIDAALQQFKAATATFQDWMELGWAEVYDDAKLGQGVRALRDIHMPASKAKEAQRDVAALISVVAADLHCARPECVLDKTAAREADPTYLVQLDKQRVFDARHHWMGKINHLPDRLCNLRLTSAGKLMQTREIAAGEALAFDYGVDYWVYQLSGLDTSDWLSEGGEACRRSRSALFTRMHELVLDYSEVLRQEWARSLSSASSAVDREGLLVELENYLDAWS